jgi:hypothetical protein
MHQRQQWLRKQAAQFSTIGLYFFLYFKYAGWFSFGVLALL